jgi:broad specificity phosphatase PhoE
MAGDPVVKTLYLLRHGESAANILPGRAGREIHDPFLTAEGERQARSWLALSRGWGAEVVLCSPLRRTLRTALLAFAGGGTAGPPIELSSSLREYHWEDPQNQGHTAEALQAELAGWEAVERVDAGSLVRLATPSTQWDPAAEASMAPRELAALCAEFFASGHLETELLSRPETVVAVVSHFGTIHALCDGAWAHQFGRGEKPRLRHGGLKVEVHASLRWSVSLLACPAQQQQQQQQQPCRFFLQGHCRHGDACRFSHHAGGAAAAAVAAAGPGAGQPDGRDGRTASVLVVGRSRKLGDQWAVLLGGAFNTAGLCFCDFGGGVEHYDRGQPHHAACRELAEELLSLGWRDSGGGDKGAAKRAARAVMERCCAATGLNQDQFVRQHTHETARGHFQMVMRAEWVCEHDGGTIDTLHDRFVANKEIKQLALVPLAELVRAICDDDDEVVAGLPVYSLGAAATPTAGVTRLYVASFAHYVAWLARSCCGVCGGGSGRCRRTRVDAQQRRLCSG